MKKSKLLETGQKFGRLTVVELDHVEYTKDNSGKTCNKEFYKCICECKNEVIVLKNYLKNGHKRSCGCLHEEATKEKFLGASKTHGMSETRLFYIWKTMKVRCNCKTNKNYSNYGGRGITVCQEWQDDFMKFYDWSMNNGYNENAPRKECTLDRIDNNKGYSPDNCRWTNFKVQANNNRGNHAITYNGVTKNICEWEKEYDLPRHTILNRIRKGWDLDDVFNKPRGYIENQKLISENSKLNTQILELQSIINSEYKNRRLNKSSSLPGPGAYYNEQNHKIGLNYNSKLLNLGNIVIGKEKRFLKKEKDQTPGPGSYNIPGLINDTGIINFNSKYISVPARSFIGKRNIYKIRKIDSSPGPGQYNFFSIFEGYSNSNKK